MTNLSCLDCKQHLPLLLSQAGGDVDFKVFLLDSPHAAYSHLPIYLLHKGTFEAEIIFFPMCLVHIHVLQFSVKGKLNGPFHIYASTLACMPQRT